MSAGNARPLFLVYGACRLHADGEVDMVDGFHWTRVTSKQLRFLYEEITQAPLPEHMRELARNTDRNLTAGSGQQQAFVQPAVTEPRPEACTDGDAALRNPNSDSDV
jgi:hypothetical protein